MPIKREMQELLEACERCADSDERSYDKHLSDCPKCSEYAERLEKMNQMVEVLELMASKPLESRKTILKARMNSFLEMTSDKAKEAISGMLDGLEMLSENDRVAVVKARTDILMEMKKEQRQKLMEYLGQIMKEWDKERKEMERRAVMIATEDYFMLKKMMIRMKFRKMM